MPQKEARNKKRNYAISKRGIMRFGKGRMYAKRAAWRYKKDKVKPAEKPKPKAQPRMIKKPIGGEKNGETRMVPVKRAPRYFPTEEPRHKLKSRKGAFKDHKRNLRSTIQPGTVLILVAGRQKGKRVVFLKQLASGLLLVTGPFKLNDCPLRRINQIYVIATKTRLDISDLSMPERLTDSYFKRNKGGAAAKDVQGQGDIFETKKETYTVTVERKEDQKIVDDQILAKIKEHPDKKLIFGYLGAMFSLKNKQYPHKMVF